MKPAVEAAETIDQVVFIVPLTGETVHSTTYRHTNTLKLKRYRSVAESNFIQSRNQRGDHRIKQMPLSCRAKIKIEHGIMLANCAGQSRRQRIQSGA
mgnify:CR=1 FL=1|tara:strand:+ start:2270 stop:2560 length:291 start_codon:yes stop_codon:yes gene_type:complete